MFTRTKRSSFLPLSKPNAFMFLNHVPDDSARHSKMFGSFIFIANVALQSEWRVHCFPELQAQAKENHNAHVCKCLSASQDLWSLRFFYTLHFFPSTSSCFLSSDMDYRSNRISSSPKTWRGRCTSLIWKMLSFARKRPSISQNFAL